MMSVPTLNFRTQTDYVYNHAWHTLFDTYSELVPYTEQQKESALVTAVVAYGAANLDKPLTRDGVYLADGLYADIAVGTAESQIHVMTTLDYVNAPLQTANFIRIVEGNAPPGGRGEGGGPGGGRGGGRGGPGGPASPPIGSVGVKDGLISGLIASPAQKSAAIPALPLASNAALRHETAGILGVSAPDAFYLTLQRNPALDRKFTAIGKVIAGLGQLQEIKQGDALRSIRITRVGQAARDFKTDEESFKKLLGAAAVRK
jgi:hypothetical protein